jgi:mannose-6-phosphate isomerase
MAQLYPLRFYPILKERIWGGNRLSTILEKDIGDLTQVGESWELSAVEDHISVVANGKLMGNDLQELIEVYMGDLVGETVYSKFGPEFPLLIKFIDAEDDLSIQVHPGDKLSGERHNAYGKTEMWYVLDADPGAKLISGFNQEVNKEKYLEYLESGRLLELLHFEDVSKGNVFFIPAGRVHAIGKGILVAEIQQTSDITYRIFDYNRTDKKGKHRTLHTELALDAIDFSPVHSAGTDYQVTSNTSNDLVSCEYFITNLLELDQPVQREISQLDSFVVYICVQGTCSIKWPEGTEFIMKGETILVPASLEEFELIPGDETCRLLEVYYPNHTEVDHAGVN